MPQTSGTQASSGDLNDRSRPSPTSSPSHQSVIKDMESVAKVSALITDVSAPAILPWTAPTVQDILKRRDKLCTTEEKAQAWADTAETVKNYSDEMVKRWNAEIDTYLVYAGLFSAILTAFNVQSYQLLQPAPASDPVLVALQQISAQLGSFSTNPPFINSTQPAYRQADMPAPPAPPTAVWLNALWFSSLILSLSSASVGIMVKQWLNEYGDGIAQGTSRETARLRQYRLNNLLKWRVGTIVMSIPVLLQLALALFLTGLLVLLWTLHTAVAATASVLVLLLAGFTLGTIILPLVKFGCAYLSPQTFALDIVCHQVTYILSDVRFRVFGALGQLIEAINGYLSGRTQQWSEAFGGVLDKCAGIGPREFRTWRGRERSVTTADQDTTDLLDADLLVMAYDVSMDRRTLSAAATCLTELQPQHVLTSFRMLDTVHLSHYSSRHRNSYSKILFAELTLWINTLVCLAAVDSGGGDRTADWHAILEDLDSYLPFSMKFYRPDILLEVDARRAEWMLSAASSLVCNDGGVLEATFRPFAGLLVMRNLLTGVESPADGGVILCTAAAAGRYLQEKPWDEGPQTTTSVPVGQSIAVATILLQCVTRAAKDGSGVSHEDLGLLVSCAHDVLLHLEEVLRTIERSPRRSNVVEEEVAALIDVIVAEHAGTLGTVVPLALVPTLEHMVAAQRDALLPDIIISWIASEVDDCERRLKGLRELAAPPRAVSGTT